MPEATSNTSPLLYLYRIGRAEWLARLFGTVYIPNSVAAELRQGRERGFDIPDPDHYSWVQLQDPRLTPSEWLALDLGPGELGAMALALENPNAFYCSAMGWRGELPLQQVYQSGVRSRSCSKLELKDAALGC